MLKAFLVALLFVSASTGAVRAFAPCATGQSEMSVEGVEGIFCVDGTRICIADISDGACPPKQTGLEFGSYCGLVVTKVYGCKMLTKDSILTLQPSATPAPTTTVPAPATPAPTTVSPAPSTPAPTTTSLGSNLVGGTLSFNCPDGTAEMSVEGVEGYFCVKGGPLCAADVKNGLCPGVETPRLSLGSYCGVVASGVYGCKVSTTTSTMPASTTVSPGTPAPTPAPTTATPGTPAPTPAPTTVSPGTPASTTKASTTATPLSSTGGASTSSQTAPGSNCPVGESEVSVEGVKGFFCIPGGPICSGNVSTGLCPGKNDRLPIGSYCGVVASGVYGCKILNAQSAATLTPAVTPASTTKAPTPSSIAPVTPAPTTPTPSTSAPTPSNTTATPSTSTSADCPNGGTPMSVEGCHKIFCVQGVACAGEISNGTCPTANAAMGLPKGSYCTIVRPGVYGCKPIA